MDRSFRIGLRAGLWAAVALVLSGCQALNFYKDYAATPIDVSKRDTAYDKIEASVRERTKASAECFPDQYKPGQTAADCFGIRNQVISYLMSESVAICVKHVSGIYGNEAGFNIATGSIASLTSGFAAISPGSRAASLAAISSFTSAERALVNESVYKNLLTTAIATKIEQSRSTLGKALLAKKKEKYEDYRIDDAIYDVIDYHHACSFYKGMELALAEGTNTNPATKLALLETQGQALAQQIDIRAQALKIDEAGRQKLLDPKAVTGDPILKSLMDRYQAIQQQILTGLQQPGPVTQKDPPLSAGPAPIADVKPEDAPNPIAGLVASEAKVRKASTSAIQEALKKLAEEEKKTLPAAYLTDVGAKGRAFADRFHAELFGTGKAGNPADGSFATKLKAYHSAQSDYLVKTSVLDKTKLDDQLAEAGFAITVKRAALELKDLQRQVSKCEAAALKRAEAFQAAQVAAVKGKKDEEIAKWSAIQGEAPAWTDKDTKDCLQ